MAIANTAHGATKTSSTAVNTTGAIATTAAVGETIIVTVGTVGAASNAPTDTAGNKYGLIHAAITSTVTITVWACLSNLGASPSITCTFGATARYGVAISTYSGVADLNIANNAQTSGTTSPQTVTLPKALQTGGWALACFVVEGTGTWGATTGNLRDNVAGASSTTPGAANLDNTATGNTATNTSLSHFVGLGIELEPTLVRGYDDDARQEQKWVDNYSFQAVRQHDDLDTLGIPPRVPPLADPARFALASDDIIIGDVLDEATPTAPSVFPDIDSDAMWRDWRVTQYDDSDTQSNKPIVVVTTFFTALDEPLDRWVDWRATFPPDISQLDEPGQLGPPPVTYEPDEVSKFDATWRAFQYDDTETQRASTPTPPTTQEPEDVSKWDASWKAFQYEDVDTASFMDADLVAAKSIQDEISERWVGWQAFQYDDLDTAQFTSVPSLAPVVEIDEISERWTDWRQPWHEDVESQRGDAPTPPFAIPDLDSDQRWVDWRSVYDHIADTDEPGQLGAPAFAYQEEPIEKNVDWRALQPDEHDSFYPIVVVVVPTFGPDEISERWSDWRAAFPPDISALDEPGQIGAPAVAIQDEISERWTDWRQAWHEDVETQRTLPPTPPFSIQEEHAEQLFVGWSARQPEDDTLNTTDNDFLAPTAFQEEPIERWADWRQLWHEDVETQRAFAPTPPFVIPDEVSERTFDWRALQPGDDDYLNPPTPPEVEPETADDQELLQMSGLWRAMQPDDDQVLPPTPPFAIQEEPIEKYAGWSALQPEDDWRAFAPTPPFAIIDEISERWVGWMQLWHEDVETQSTPAPTPAFSIQEEASEQRTFDWRALQPGDDDYLNPPTPPEVEPETADDQELLQMSGLWRAMQPDDDQVLPPTPPFSIQDEVSERTFDWRSLQPGDDDYLNPPAPPTTQEPEDVSKFDASWRAWQPEDVDNTKTPPAPPPVQTSYEDNEFHAKAFDTILKYHEDDWATYPPTPPPTIQEEPIEKWAGWFAIYEPTPETDEPGQLGPPAFAIQDEISERWSDWRQPWHDDTETQQTQTPTPPEVEPETADDFEALSQISGYWRALEHDDDQAFTPTPPFAIVDEISERWSGWFQPYHDDLETQRTFPPTPPEVEPETADDFEALAQISGYWRAVDAEDRDPAFAPTPPFAIVDEISERWVGWFQNYQDDTETQRTFPPTPPEVEPETADDFEALAQISGYWRATQPDDDQAFAPTPPQAIDQDAEHAQWAGWMKLYVEDDWATYPPPAPFVIQEEHTEQKNVDWTARQYLDEETQQNNAPTPPFAIPDLDSDQRWSDWRAFNPEEIDNTKIPPPPPVIVTGYIDDEFHAKAFDTILKYYEDDWRALPPTPPTTFEPDDVSKFDASWKAYQYLDEETQRELPPTPPFAIQEEPIEKWAGWQALQYEDTESQRGDAPTPPFAIIDEVSERWADWRQVWHDDTETQRTFPPTAPSAIQDEISERFVDWRALQPDDVPVEKTPPPPFVVTQEGQDDLEAWFKVLEKPVAYHEDDVRMSPPTPPTTFQEEPIERTFDWRVPQQLDEETQRGSTPTPPTTFQEEPIERTFDWRVGQQTDQETENQVLFTPPQAIDQDAEAAKWTAWFTPLITDDWTTETPAPPPAIIDEISERWTDWFARQYDDTESQQTETPPPPTTFQEEPIERTFDWRVMQQDDTETERILPPPPPIVPLTGYDDYDLWYKPQEIRAPWPADEFEEILVSLGWLFAIDADTTPDLVATALNATQSLVATAVQAVPSLICVAASTRTEWLTAVSARVVPSMVAVGGWVVQNKLIE